MFSFLQYIGLQKKNAKFCTISELRDRFSDSHSIYNLLKILIVIKYKIRKLKKKKKLLIKKINKKYVIDPGWCVMVTNIA